MENIRTRINSISNTLKILSLIIIPTFLISCAFKQKVKYQFIGEFRYEITNDSLFSNTYLTDDSYGFLIGDLKIPGLKIFNTESIEDTSDYIVSMHHPIKSAHINSYKAKSEGMDEYLNKKALDIKKDTLVKTKSIFLYRLEEKNKYRLLLP